MLVLTPNSGSDTSQWSDILPKSPRGFFRDKNWNSERESLVSILKAHRVPVAHPVIIRAPKIMSFSNGSSKRNGPTESLASGSWH